MMPLADGTQVRFRNKGDTESGHEKGQRDGAATATHRRPLTLQVSLRAHGIIA